MSVNGNVQGQLLRTAGILLVSRLVLGLLKLKRGAGKNVGRDLSYP